MKSLPDNRILAGFVLAAVLGFALHFSGVLRPLDLRLSDLQMDWLRRNFPRPVANDVVIVGIDEATYAALPEPHALWHPYYGRFLKAMAVARPSVLGFDIILPAKSYDFVVPDNDRKLLEGIAALKGKAPLVLGRTLDNNNNFRSVYHLFVAVAGEDAFGSVSMCKDEDGVVRQFVQYLCEEGVQSPTLAGLMAERLGSSQDWRGMINFKIGDPFDYIPLHRVLEWEAAGNIRMLEDRFRARPVLLGLVMPFEDRDRIPVPLAAWEPENHQVSGVLLHAQVLRSMLNEGLIAPVAKWIVLLCVLIASLFWFGPRGWAKAVAFVIFAAAVPLAALLLLRNNLQFPVSGILASGAIGFFGRIAQDAVVDIHERVLLRRAFAGYVSPEVMGGILRGKISPELGGVRQHVVILISDIRDFTRRSESAQPEATIALLNAYFSEMTAAIHLRGGTVDKFLGDGLLAVFGSPQPLPSAERAALEAAQEMMLRLKRLNRKLEARGEAPLRIGVGIHAGDVVAGHVGSKSRHEYTLIGDTVNAASRLEAATKSLGFPVICSEPVADAVGFSGGLVDLGMQEIRGRSPMRLFGWNPPITA
jgi:class 3 adenylate cyclase/CHASE2 domain-containing sensor protein